MINSTANPSPRSVSPLTGALIGLLATAPLIAIFYAGGQLASLPQPFFELFDKLSRSLPGAVVTFGIDTMVSIFSKLPITTDVASKAAEQSIAIGQFLVLGAIFGALIAYILGRVRPSMPSAYIGVGVALIPLVLTLIVTNFYAANANGTLTAASWVLLMYAMWGIVVSSALEYVAALRRRAAPTADVSATKTPATANASRRAFLIQFGGGALALTVVSWAAGRLLGGSSQVFVATDQTSPDMPTATPLPGGVTPDVMPVRGTRLEVTPNNMFYRVDINSDPPHISQSGWALTVTGSVEKALTYSYDEFRKLPATEQDATLECISNPVGGGLISSTHWKGVKLADLLKLAGVKTSAVEIKFTCGDGYTESIPVASAMDERTLLAYDTNGEPLRPEHGFPLRLWTQNRYGMKNPKWITAIEAIDAPHTGYWVERGWNKDAFVKSTSVIDVIGTDQAVNGLVPIGGIAFGGARGISKVEVQVDGGEWQVAKLKDPISPLTWRLWRLDWQAPKGYHTIVVRATDGDGMAQIQAEAPLHPSGASGYVSKTANVA